MSSDIEREQTYVSMLYGHVDQLRQQAVDRLRDVLGQAPTHHQARGERAAASARYTDQIARYNAVESGLCFGRLDFLDGTRRYIGRLGIHDVSTDSDPLLMDWRAPAAQPFYLATVATPDGVSLRRQIEMRDRRVIGIEDEALDRDVASESSHTSLTNESALLAAITASRSGQMSDIVRTIQAEQDRIIRSDHGGVLVVEGGPGTGKTAVALHRAAFLLYTHRVELSRRGVLIVGPNTTFLRYIGQVLPGLGENAVLLSTIGDLFPGVSASAKEHPRAAEVKGRLAMADVVAAAIRGRQRVPDEPQEIRFDRETLLLDRVTCEKARDQARDSGLPHNQAQHIFVREAIDALAGQIAARVGADVLGEPNLLTEADLLAIRTELSEDPEVYAALTALWPIVTPEQLITDLYADPDRLRAAAPDLGDDELAALYRPANQEWPANQDQPANQDWPPNQGWTPADVPLLDEAAELLGEDDRAAVAEAERGRLGELAYAEGVLDILSRDIEDDPEVLMAYDLVDADRLAQRHTQGEWMSIADRAAMDRRWVFGHVIVDEAQELSEMAWRMLMRRCPSRSMTLVGDVAQTGDLAGTRSWDATLSRYVSDRWRLAQLTVNYRTPTEVMDVAAGVLAAIDPNLRVPRSIRDGGVPPWRLRVKHGELAQRLDEVVASEVSLLGDGRLAVLVPTESADVRADLHADLDLGEQVVYLTVRQAKGLEFDSVIVVEPARIAAESPRGLNDLYVAVTRATQRLGVIHTADLPEPLLALSAVGPPSAG